jgi:hypothetical protein
VALVVRDLAGQEVELAGVRLAQRVAVDHVLGLAVDVHAAVDADEVVRLAGQREQIVRDGDHTEAELVLEAPHQRVELLLGRQVEAGGRLIEDQQLRAGAQRLRQHHAPLLAARERTDRTLRTVADADPHQRIGDRLQIGAPRAPPGAEVCEAPHQDDVAYPRRELRVDRITLRHVADLARHIGRGAGRPAEHLDAPRAIGTSPSSARSSVDLAAPLDGDAEETPART